MIGKPVLMAWWKCTSRKGTTYPTHPHSVLAENFALHHRAQARRESEPYISRSMSRQQTSVGSPRFIDPLQLHPIQHEIGTITFASSRFVSSRARGWWLTERVLLYFFLQAVLLMLVTLAVVAQVSAAPQRYPLRPFGKSSAVNISVTQ